MYSHIVLLEYVSRFRAIILKNPSCNSSGRMAKYFIERISERIIILFRQARNQVEMLVNFPAFFHHRYRTGKFFEVLAALYKFICQIIC